MASPYHKPWVVLAVALRVVAVPRVVTLADRRRGLLVQLCVPGAGQLPLDAVPSEHDDNVMMGMPMAKKSCDHVVMPNSDGRTEL